MWISDRLAGLLDGGVDLARGHRGVTKPSFSAKSPSTGPGQLASSRASRWDGCRRSSRRRPTLGLSVRREEGELAAHAEADRAELGRRGVRGEVRAAPARSFSACAMFSAMKSLPAPSGSLAVWPWYMSGARAEKPSAAKRSQTLLMWRHQAPPLLDHEHARALAGWRASRDSPEVVRPFGRKLHHLAGHASCSSCRWAALLRSRPAARSRPPGRDLHR